MSRLLEKAQIVALAAVTFLCIALGVAVLGIRHDIQVASWQFNATLVEFTKTTKQVALTLTTDVDRLTTRADRLMIVAGATATEAHLAAQSQRVFWEKQTPELVNRITKVLDSTDRVLGTSNQLLLTTDTAVAGLNDTNTQLRRSIEQVTFGALETTSEATKTVKTFRDLTVDPDFLTMKTNATRMTAGAAQMTEDAAYKFHRYVHPEELKGAEKVWFYTKGAVSFLKDLVMLLYFWP